MTRMACTNERLILEHAFLEVLGSAAKNNLVLTVYPPHHATLPLLTWNRSTSFLPRRLTAHFTRKPVKKEPLAETKRLASLTL